jgi:hypothetical protein
MLFANPFAFWTVAAIAQMQMATMFWSTALAPFAARPRRALRLVARNPALERSPARARLALVR